MIEALVKPVVKPAAAQPARVEVEAVPADDLSPLAWVHGELRRSLESAHKLLRRHLKEAAAVAGSDVDAVDPAVLRNARAQLHQGVGALELVGLPAVANVLRASEAAVQRMAARPVLVTAAVVGTIEQVSFALLDFLARQLAGKPVSPLLLFPQYRAVLQLAGAEREHPADLWPCDWHWRELPADPEATPGAADETARSAMESQVLALMRAPGAAAYRRMSALCADVGAGMRAVEGGEPVDGTLLTLWQLAAAVFEALSDGLLDADIYTRRIPSRLLSQLRAQVAGRHESADRLARDLLFFCSHARAVPAGAAHAPRLAAVRHTWRLETAPTADYETKRLGRFDPAQLALARKRVATAKDIWSAAAGGESHRSSGLADAFSLVGDSLTRLLPSGDALAQALQGTVVQVAASGAEPPATLAMEVATAMLFVDATLEDGELDHPELAARVQHLAKRIDAVRRGAEPAPLESWMEDLYRRVSDRQTMGSVVQELRCSLSEVEKLIDGFFRNPADRKPLLSVPAQLSAMRGVLSVLGLDHASQAVLRMRGDVDALMAEPGPAAHDTRPALFDHLADNLGALSFLIDMISVQPQLAKSLFRFDPATGNLNAVMGLGDRGAAVADFAATAIESEDTLPATEAQPSPMQPTAPMLLVDLDDGEPVGTQPAENPTDESFQPIPSVSVLSGLEDDAEMREVFVEEAREVVAEGLATLARLAETPDDSADLTALRRAFHTLKGSSRMVGLFDFGDAGWSCEQIYNAQLAQAPQMDARLNAFTQQALAYLADWVEAIAAGVDRGHHAGAVVAAADALRLDAAPVAIVLPWADAADRSAPDETVSFAEKTETFPRLPDLPGLLDLPDLPNLPLATEVVDFEFRLDDAGPDQALAPPATLSDRVPNLPSADDLDLPAPTLAFDRADDPDFALDLDGGSDLGGHGTVPPALPEAETLELSDDAFGGIFDAPATADTDSDGLPAAAVDGASEPEPTFEPAPQAEATEALPQPTVTELAVTLQAEPVEEEAEAVDAVANGDVAAAAEPVEASSEEHPLEDEQVRVIGPLRIGIPLFNIYLNEADELSRRLCTELAEWSQESEHQPVPESAVARAHSLAGSSATVGYVELSALARSLEHALMRSHAAGHGREDEPALFVDAGDEIRRLLHQFAAGFLRPVPAVLMERLAEHERLPVEHALEVAPELAVAVSAEGLLNEPEASADAAADAIDAVDAVDAVD
ncbi:MAG: Hpt domain-containing protein, partial [Pseudomonadota bacterium]|nr:Hpt domain-containing protein [Pseudomonadota bacterium]